MTLDLIIRRTQHGTTLITTDRSMLTYSAKGTSFCIFTDLPISSRMADDITNSGLVEVTGFDVPKGFIYVKRRDMFDLEKFENLFCFIFEKYEV